MTNPRLISADSHVAIPIGAIRDRVPAGLREPFDDAIAAQAERDAELRGGRTMSMDDWDMEAARDPGYREPHARLAAMDRDGVHAEVLYSEVSAFRAFGLVQGDWKPISRAFTDLMSEFAAVDPDRLAVSYQVPVIDVEYAVSEVERLAALGARSVHLPNYPTELGLPDYWDERYDPLWGVLQETRISISHHLGVRNWLYDVFRRDPTRQAAVFTSLPSLALAEVLGLWILSGTLERFPGLQIVFVEPSLYWVPGFLAGFDRKYEGPYDLSHLSMKPSQYFHRNMALTFMDDEVGLQSRHLVGIENILWSTDFPHPATTWPNSRDVVERQFAGIPSHERDAICSENAARIYRL
ncbi:MAG: amidohydrolase [Actinobacteria bacterium]|nr:amidohydrolase [Actinomycetota bacterium]